MTTPIHVLAYTKRSVGAGISTPTKHADYDTDFTKPLAHAFGQKWLFDLASNSQPVVIWLFSVLRHGDCCLPPSLDARIEVAGRYCEQEKGLGPRWMARLFDGKNGYKYVFAASPEGSFFYPWNDFSEMLAILHRDALCKNYGTELIPSKHFAKMLQSFQTPRRLSQSFVSALEAYANQLRAKKKAFISYRRCEAALCAMQAVLHIGRLGYAPWFDQWSMPRQVAEERVLADDRNMRLQILRALRGAKLAVSLHTTTYGTPSSPYTELELKLIQRLAKSQTLQHIPVFFGDCKCLDNESAGKRILLELGRRLKSFQHPAAADNKVP